MPATDRYYPLGSSERDTLNYRAIKEENNRRKGFKTALDYYRGKHNTENVDDVIVNLVKLTCDRTVQFLFPQFPIFELDTGTFEDTLEEVYLVEAFRANKGLAFLNRLATLGFLSGHNFVRVDPPAKSTYTTYPKFTIINPLSVRIYWDSIDFDKTIWYEVRYRNNTNNLIDNITDDNYFLSDTYTEDIVQIDTDVWSIFTYDTNGALINTSIHNSPLPPIIEWAHYPSIDSRYGVSEFGQKVLQDKINTIANTLYKVTVANAEPKDILLGTSVTEIEQSDDNLIVVGGQGADVKRLEIKGNMAGIATVLDRLIEVYLNVSRTVLLKGEPVDLQRVTNAAIRTLFLDSLAKREVLMSSYSEGITDISKLVLLMGYKDGKLNSNMFDSDLDINFHIPLPVDLSEIVNQNALAIQGGYMSKATAASRLGLDWRFEQSNLETETPVEEPIVEIVEETQL